MATKTSKKSAYFSESDDSRLDSLCNFKERGNKNVPRHELPPSIPSSVIEFPHHTGILWDRTRLSAKICIQSCRISPQLVLSPYEANLLLTMIEIPTSNIMEFNIELRRCDQLEKDIRECIEPLVKDSHIFIMSKFSSNILSAQCQKSNKTLAMCTRNISPCTLSVPVSESSSTTDMGNILTFPKDLSKNMVQNLAKSIRFGREFSLRSIFRYRAVGYCRSSGISQRMMGTIRFELVAPNISFTAVQIAPLPILSTALAITLLSICDSSSSSTSSSAKINVQQQSGFVQELRDIFELPKLGFLTLNQTRKLVYLLESDECLSRVPVVGVWVCLAASDMAPTLSVHTILNHPFVWGALVRFICSDHIKRRAQLEDHSFLLSLLVGSKVFFFEIKSFADIRCSIPFSDISLSCDDSFICQDFTIDLSTDRSTLDGEEFQETPYTPIICKFKPLTKVEYIEAFRGTTSSPHMSSPVIVGGRGSERNEIQSQVSTTAISGFERNGTGLMSRKSREDLHLETKSIESRTPLPRQSCPEPSPSRHVSPSYEEDDSIYIPDEYDVSRHHPTHNSSNSRNDDYSSLYDDTKEPEYTSFEGAVASLPESGSNNKRNVQNSWNGNDGNSDISPRAASIIASQQLQLEALQKEVEGLKQFIARLYSPDSPSSSSTKLQTARTATSSHPPIAVNQFHGSERDDHPGPLIDIPRKEIASSAPLSRERFDIQKKQSIKNEDIDRQTTTTSIHHHESLQNVVSPLLKNDRHSSSDFDLTERNDGRSSVGSKCSTRNVSFVVDDFIGLSSPPPAHESHHLQQGDLLDEAASTVISENSSVFNRINQPTNDTDDDIEEEEDYSTAEFINQRRLRGNYRNTRTYGNRRMMLPTSKALGHHGRRPIDVTEEPSMFVESESILMIQAKYFS